MIEQIQQNRFDPNRLFIERGVLRCLLHAVQQRRSLRRIMNNQLVALGGRDVSSRAGECLISRRIAAISLLTVRTLMPWAAASVAAE